MAKKTTEETIERYSKEDFLKSKAHDYSLEVLDVILDENTKYSKEEVASMYKKFIEREVR